MESIEDHWEDKLVKVLMYLSLKQIYPQVSLTFSLNFVHNQAFLKNLYILGEVRLNIFCPQINFFFDVFIRTVYVFIEIKER